MREKRRAYIGRGKRRALFLINIRSIFSNFLYNWPQECFILSIEPRFTRRIFVASNATDTVREVISLLRRDGVEQFKQLIVR